jgi:hypothetical protein
MLKHYFYKSLKNKGRLFKKQSNGRKHHIQSNDHSVNVGFSPKTMKTKDSGMTSTNCQPMLLYPVKIFFKNGN